MVDRVERRGNTDKDTDYISLVDGYASETYKRYLSLFETWCEQSASFLHKKGDTRVISLEGIKNNAFVINQNGQPTNVQLPRYEPIAEQIKRLTQEYQFIYTHRLAVATSQEDVKSIVQQLTTLHAQILQLYWYVHLARSPQKTELEELRDLQHQAKSLKKSGDAIRRKKVVLKLAAWLTEHASDGTSSQSYKQKLAPTALLSDPPTIGKGGNADGDHGDSDGDGDGIVERKKKGKKSKGSKKEPTSNKEKIEHVKDKVLQLVIHHAFPLNKFKFTRHDQCLETFSKSKAYTISKTEFIETIEQDEDLKKLFPKNYKSLSKEKLCDILFKTSKGNVA